MKWIKRKVQQWANEPTDEDLDYNHSGKYTAIKESTVPDTNSILNFRIYSAQNGMILEFRHYNARIDTSDVSSYIVPEDHDIVDYVRQCLPMEIMKVNR